MRALRWTPLCFLGLLLVGCPSRRPVDDDDSAADDDDSAAADDDDATVDDDDDGTPATALPVIVNLEVCQQAVLLGAFGRFEIEVTDAQGDLSAPVAYRVRIDTAATVPFQWDEDLGGHGWIDHTVQLLQGNLTRGSQHTFTFEVLDDAGNVSAPVEVTWTIPLDPDAEPCE